MCIAAVILAGGASSRFGPPGTDKTAAPLTADGRSVLDHLISTVPSEWSVIVVGPGGGRSAPVGTQSAGSPSAGTRSRRTVRWMVESPVGGGPVAGLTVAAEVLADHPAVSGSAVVSVMVALAGDMPFAATAAQRCAETLLAAPNAVDAVVSVGPDGRRQPLAAAYRPGPFIAAVRDTAAQCGGTPSGHDLSLHAVLSRLRVQICSGAAVETLDVDTLPDLALAQTVWAAETTALDPAPQPFLPIDPTALSVGRAEGESR